MDQHLYRILSTNLPPNALETSALQSGIHDLDSKIAHLRSQVQELARLEDQVRQYHAALSPMRRLPPELLGEVFRYVLPLVDDKDSMKVVTALGLVCKGWRDATLGVHHFWCHLTVGNLAGRYDETVDWMSRSGALPRTLHLLWDRVDQPHRCSRDSCRLSNPEMIQLLGRGPDIHHLILECQRPRCLQQLLVSLHQAETRPFRRTWDNIQDLDLTFGEDDDEFWSQTQGLTSFTSDSPFSLLPPITSFRLSLPSADVAFPGRLQSRFGKLDIPQTVFERLTNLKIRSDWEGNHILTMLSQCPNLEALTFDTRYMNWRPRRPPAVPESILLPKLRTLHLLNDGMFNLLNYIDAPDLETLELRGDGGPDAGSLAFLLDSSHSRNGFLQNLRYLHICDGEFPEPMELVLVLSSLPALRHVKLDQVVVNWVTVWAGMPTGEQDRPSLKQLEVLEVLQIKQEYAVEFFPALFGFLVERGPRSCKLTVSFEKVLPPTYEDATTAWDVWKRDDEVSGRTLDEFGISLQVLPPVDEEDSQDEE